MKKILYYPGFEVQDETWLKFALLYLSKINTIVPNEAEPFLSRGYNLIYKETNLLDKYPPEYSETDRTTHKVIEIVSTYLKDPLKHYESLGKINIVNFWRQKENQNYELFNTKFSKNFELFCRDWGFSHESQNGIKIPSQLATIYMGILAHTIGQNKNMSIITDIEHEQQIISLSDDLWNYNKDFEEIKYIKNYLSLLLPDNLNSIPIEKIIDLRNKDDFQKKLNAFHLALEQLTLSPNHNLSDISYKEITENIKWSIKELGADILNFSSSLLITTLGISLACTGSPAPLEILKESLGAVPTAGTGWQLYKNIHSSQRRLASQYITDIRNLNPPQKRTNRIPDIPIF
ncbi:MULTISPECIES: hypothetical protein [Bacillus]|uniref:hypothetical protein n=1 Tax=Bacillus TaxID=1386 RepID=UPI00032EDBE1|nr:hypothetical protein [Bacillus cereus group sp. N17]EOP29443.1 hypothetical protein IIS_05119 [Bacillus cereus VD131]MBJ8042461.1 hypothetical protein [Bacillus cereus group sp. N17]